MQYVITIPENRPARPRYSVYLFRCITRRRVVRGCTISTPERRIRHWKARTKYTFRANRAISGLLEKPRPRSQRVDLASRIESDPDLFSLYGKVL